MCQCRPSHLCGKSCASDLLRWRSKVSPDCRSIHQGYWFVGHAYASICIPTSLLILCERHSASEVLQTVLPLHSELIHMFNEGWTPGNTGQGNTFRVVDFPDSTFNRLAPFLPFGARSTI